MALLEKPRSASHRVEVHCFCTCQRVKNNLMLIFSGIKKFEASILCMHPSRVEACAPRKRNSKGGEAGDSQTFGGGSGRTGRCGSRHPVAHAVASIAERLHEDFRQNGGVQWGLKKRNSVGTAVLGSSPAHIVDRHGTPVLGYAHCRFHRSSGRAGHLL